MTPHGKMFLLTLVCMIILSFQSIFLAIRTDSRNLDKYCQGHYSTICWAIGLQFTPGTLYHLPLLATENGMGKSSGLYVTIDFLQASGKREWHFFSTNPRPSQEKNPAETKKKNCWALVLDHPKLIRIIQSFFSQQFGFLAMLWFCWEGKNSRGEKHGTKFA